MTLTVRKVVYGYIDYLAEAFLISKANRYDIKGRKYVGANLKYYFSDVGLRNARLNFRQQEPTHRMYAGRCYLYEENGNENEYL